MNWYQPAALILSCNNGSQFYQGTDMKPHCSHDRADICSNRDDENKQKVDSPDVIGCQVHVLINDGVYVEGQFALHLISKFLFRRYDDYLTVRYRGCTNSVIGASF